MDLKHVPIVGSYRPARCKGKKNCAVVSNLDRSKQKFEENVNETP